MKLWITLQKLVDKTGYSVNAIQNRRLKGCWQYGTHWIKENNNPKSNIILFNEEAIIAWQEGSNNGEYIQEKQQTVGECISAWKAS